VTFALPRTISMTSTPSLIKIWKQSFADEVHST
jgi:hypothetical protein